MRINQDVQSNSFNKGIAIDPSDMVMPADTMRFAQNVRIVNHQSSSYVITNLQGTDEAFTLTSGYQMIASQEYANVLYIVSYNNSNGYLELGTYPSPQYTGSAGNNIYRPLKNFNGFNDFRTDLFGTTAGNIPVIQKLEIQQDFDSSVNMLFTIKGLKPRIVNTKFNAYTLAIISDRGSFASSNSYTNSTVEKETSIIPYTTQLLSVSFSGIVNGGKLKPGNYQYVFYYMTDDFNRTSVIEQSSLCQVFFGDTIDNIRGGDESEETTKQVQLSLSNIDTNFKYLKVYVLYSAGIDSLVQQYLEFVQPIEITSSSMTFYHTGYESLSEVSQDEINVEYAPINTASASTQVGGYYFLGDIKQRDVDYDTLRTAAAGITPTLTTTNLSLTASPSTPGYTVPSNTYNYLGYFGGETYAFGIVFIMKDGSTSPVFPIKSNNKGTVTADGKGLVTFKVTNSSTTPHVNSTLTNLVVRHLSLNLSTITSDTNITDNAVGLFIVRAERRPNMITQGLLVPTIKAPAVEAEDNFFDSFTDSALSLDTGGYYLTNASSISDLNIFKHLLNFDSIVEGFAYNKTSGGGVDSTVIDENGAISSGYMPLSMRYNYSSGYYDGGTGVGLHTPNIWESTLNSFSLKHWGLLSGEAFANEPEYVNSLQRTNLSLRQLSKVTFAILRNSRITPLAATNSYTNLPGVGSFGYAFACHYSMSANSVYSDGTDASNTFQTIEKSTYVPSGTVATGTDFVSKMKVALYAGNVSSGNYAHYFVNQNYDSYFGIKVSSTLLNDASNNSSNPIGPDRYNYDAYGVPLRFNVDAVSGFYNYNLTNTNVKSANAAFLVNIYPQTTPLTPANLYPTTDGLIYRQVSKRYSWSALSALSNTIPVFGGDCFTSRVSRKLTYSPEKNPSNYDTGTASVLTDGKNRWNINQGLVVTWWQESKYNLHLRQSKLYDTSDYEDRNFFPYRNSGDVIAYRSYRMPETKLSSPGYKEVLPLKSFYPISTLSPYEKQEFPTRIYHSEKYVPNAFRNGYRSILETNYKDYDTSMGPIIALFNHRGNILVVFKNGIGIGGINQRIETGRDGAGSIFVEPSTVLPPILTYMSREIGCQDNMALVQTPGAVYGIDQAKKKIWCVQDGLRVISDEAQISTWLNINPVVNPALGYDIANNEVIFKTDDWTLCYSEVVQRFTSFYSMNDVDRFARVGKQFYSTIGNQAHKHNSEVEGNYKLYNQDSDSIVEFVLNKGVTMAKIIDYFNLVSNEVPPTKIEVYVYNQNNEIEFILQPLTSDYNQYGVVQNQYDEFLQTSPIVYRDRRYVVHAPLRTVFNSGTGEQYADWDIEGRIRDKHILIRLTYTFSDTNNKPLELASVLSYFRYSRS